MADNNSNDNQDDDDEKSSNLPEKEEQSEDKEENEIKNNENALDSKGDSNENDDTNVVIVQPTMDINKSDDEKTDSETPIDNKEEIDNDSGTESDEDFEQENDTNNDNDQQQNDTDNPETSDKVSHKSLKSAASKTVDETKVGEPKVDESKVDEPKVNETKLGEPNKEIEDQRKEENKDEKHKEYKEENEEGIKGEKKEEKNVENNVDIKPHEDTDTIGIENAKREERQEEIIQKEGEHHQPEIEKKDEKPVKRIEVQEKEKENNEKEDDDDDDEEHSHESEGSRRSSRGSLSPDASEIERNIQKVGMKKRSKFQPQGELSKVLVSREMEEKTRMSKEKGKWKKMKQLFRGKTKKVKDSNQQREDGRDTQDLVDDEFFNGKNVAPFMKEYQYKKNMDQRFEEDQIREEDRQKRRERNGDIYSDSEEDDFANIITDSDEEREADEKAKEQEMNEENKRTKGSKGQDIMTEEEKRFAKHLKHKQENEKLGTDETDERKLKQKSDENGKDSGVDSPDLKKENSELNGFSENEDYDDFEMIELPPGYMRDSNGQIIRTDDGEIIDEEELKSIFRLAKLGVIFHVPRLKRTSNGRPTGGYVTDPFGPKKDKNKILNVDGRTDHSKPKHPRSSRASGRKDHRDMFQQKSVAFDMNDDFADILMDDDMNDKLNEKDPSLENRELLKKRLFRNKRKRGLDNRLYQSEDGPPRELNELVRVIPQGSGPRYQSNGVPIPGTVLSRNDSLKNKYDPDQQQVFRDGLATDRRILEQSPSMQRRPGVPKEAFIYGDDTDDMRERMQNKENEERQHRLESGVNIGSDDEFFLVGSRQEKPEPFFTYVRRPGQGNGKPSGSMQALSNDGFCIRHDMRHAMPWSLLNKNPVRESSISDINLNKSKAPKSADNAKRDIDDKRLKELLEELYTDKKYFDHVIDTTDPRLEPIIDERDLATHGRNFLLERAEYWDERGVKIPRPPTTALGLRLSRQFTMIPDSGRVSNISYASTVTPQPHPFQASDSQELQSPEAFVNRENTVS